MKKMFMAIILVSVLLIAGNAFAYETPMLAGFELFATDLMAQGGIDGIKAKIDCIKSAKEALTSCGTAEKILDKITCVKDGITGLQVCLAGGV